MEFDITPEQRKVFTEMVHDYGLTNTTEMLEAVGMDAAQVRRLAVDWILTS